MDETITYALCAGRHEIVIDGEDVTNKSIFPGTVDAPLDFKTNTATASKFLRDLLLRGTQSPMSDLTFRLAVTGLTPCLHAFLKAWQMAVPSHWRLMLGHYDRDTGTYVWDQMFGMSWISEEE
jgi:hypothetical protein